MRVFAGPNGSGKSTIISAIRDYPFSSGQLDFGIYVNADDIAKDLRQGTFIFDKYELTVSQEQFLEVALVSGLVSEAFPQELFRASFHIENNRVTLIESQADERLAQILADFLRKKLVEEGKKFSFETVFSHPSKLDIMRLAAEKGYKVYLYFVSTESPEINKYRVKVRVKQNGHNVPDEKIESRYYRSLELLYDAAQLTYQSFFYDNSKELKAGRQFLPFAQFRVKDGRKVWTPESIEGDKVPGWFIAYYYNKISQPEAGAGPYRPES